MKQLRIYVDTSVFGGCFDEEFREDSRALFDVAQEGKAMLLISDVLLDELRGAPEEVFSLIENLPVACFERITQNTECGSLANLYMSAGVVGQGAAADALHVAVATVWQSDVIVSWNFKHLVNLEKVRGFNAVNLKEGYPSIDIRSPREVLLYEEDEDF